jgi:N-methylhydantoinase A/oxoprolinase/acetone carboxylase beta subunit
VADARQDLVATRVTPLEEDLTGIWGRFSELEEEAAAALVAQGFAASRITFSHSLDMRYRGQHHVVEVLLPPGAVGRGEAPDLRNAFHGAHRKRYSFALEGDEVEVVNLRLQAMVPAPRIPPPEVGFGEGDALKGRRPALLLGRPAAPVHDRGRLRPGDIIQGPAIVEEEASTTLIVRGQSATVDPLGDLVIQEGA